jgi:signal transduction histidine kinase
MRTRLRSKCRNMSGLIERAVDNVGRIITDLRPSILDHQGLWAALEWQAHEFAQSAELVLDWDMQGTDGVELPEPEAMAVFRIFQEMLSNVARHAHATALTLRILVADAMLTIAVQDNGCGASALAFEAPTAYGVMGMRERARHFGGQLESSSEIGLGSAFILRLPLSNI